MEQASLLLQFIIEDTQYAGHALVALAGWRSFTPVSYTVPAMRPTAATPA
jgi:hypothetical protein